MKINIKNKLLIVLMITLFAPLMTQAQIPWAQWVSELRQEALGKGINPQLFDQVFSTIPAPDRKTLNLEQNQPEHRLTFTKYRATRGDAYRIKLGQKKYQTYQALLESIGHEYHVDPCFITALWGIESSYGHYLGDFPVIKSLATLAYNPRRSEFFRKELFYALQILNEGHVSVDNFKGEWAGASGQPQFLPSSWYRYAVDYNGDDKKDIWKNYPDAFASIANYLKENGWQEGEPWAVEVVVPERFDSNLLSKDIKKTVAEWRILGVQSANSNPLPHSDLTASIINPYGGPYLMTFNNFDVIKRYNNSTFYAGTVGYIADGICRR
jgi:membrane-bound lytic murein transglycosylase B